MRGGRRTGRRTTRRRMRRRHRRRRRRRIIVGGMVLLGVGGAIYGGIKMSKKDADRIEEHSGSSVEEMTEEELVAAMKDLGIQSIELTDEDKAALASESGGEQDAAPDVAPSGGPEEPYVDDSGSGQE